MAEGNFTKARIEAYLGRAYTYEEIRLANAGKPDSLNYISYWDSSVEKPKPTEDQLIALKSEGDAIIQSKKVKFKRRKSYGDIGDQLDMLYKDMLAGKLDATGEWAKAIKKVKDDNPKS